MAGQGQQGRFHPDRYSMPHHQQDEAFLTSQFHFTGKEDWADTDDDSDGWGEDDPLSKPTRTQGPPNPKTRPKDRHSHHGLSPSTLATAKRICTVLKGKCCIISSILAVVFIVLLALSASQIKKLIEPDEDDGLLPCGDRLYASFNETCTDGRQLCPVVDEQRSLACGTACYLPRTHTCVRGTVFEEGNPSPVPHFLQEDFTCRAEFLHLSDPPYENYFMSDCGRTSQVVVTSPSVDSDLSVVSPRLLIAWPSGNSGIAAFFSPENGVRGSLRIWLEDRPEYGREIAPFVGGLSTTMQIESPAVLDLAIMGSIRNIREYVEGPRTMPKVIETSQKVQQVNDKRVILNRPWLDGTTETFMTLSHINGTMRVEDGKVHIDNGTINIDAWTNYPQMEKLSSREVLKPEAHYLINKHDSDTAALSFMAYSDKFVAGAWRFLTYFGRDSLISLLLLQPILTPGPGGAIETILSAAIERINYEDGSVCHEEVIGDYATYLNRQDGRYNSDARCDYKMIDTDLYLPIALNEYFGKTDEGRARHDDFMMTRASLLRPNRGLYYDSLITANAEKIMRITKNFEDAPTKDHLIHLEPDELVGQWRDTTNGLGGGRAPYDVNTALVPAALKAIASLASQGFFHRADNWQEDRSQWAASAARRAAFWEDNTLAAFDVEIPATDAVNMVQEYTEASGFPMAVDADNITGIVSFHGIALHDDDERSVVKIMNTDDCFRLFLIDGTNQSQLSAFLSQAADNILRPFPVGLSNPVGLFVANPAYTGESRYVKDFGKSAYHGTVVWSWQMVMMAAGLEKQLKRCDVEQLEFCGNEELHQKVVRAYNHLWDLLEANRKHLSSEVWSWTYNRGDFHHVPLGALSPPDGQSPVDRWRLTSFTVDGTESNVKQLWSLTFLAIQRNDAYSMT